LSRSSQETRLAAAKILEVLLETPAVLEFVQDHVYSAPLPIRAFPHLAQHAAVTAEARRVTALLNEVVLRQGEIQSCRTAWDGLPPELFGGQDRKRVFRRFAVAHGLFRQIVDLYHRLKPVQVAAFAKDAKGRGFRDADHVIEHWQALYAHIRSKRPSRRFDFSMAFIPQGAPYEGTDYPSRRQLPKVFGQTTWPGFKGPVLNGGGSLVFVYGVRAEQMATKRVA
jgi:hypothetical protein